MSRFYVSIPVDYVMGFLRHGHYEGYFEAENPDQVIDMIKSPEGKDNLDFYVDDYKSIEIFCSSILCFLAYPERIIVKAPSPVTLHAVPKLA